MSRKKGNNNNDNYNCHNFYYYNLMLRYYVQKQSMVLCFGELDVSLFFFFTHFHYH